MRLLLASPLIWLLAIGAVTIALFEAIRNSKTVVRTRSYGIVIRRYWIPVISVTIVVIALLFGIPLLVCLCNLDITGSSWRYWLQTLAGNWSPDSFPPFSAAGVTLERPLPALSFSESYRFAFSATLAILLNNAAIIFLISIIWKLLAERRSAMKLKTAFAQRDLVIGTTVTKAVADLVPEKNLDQIRAIIQNSIGEARTEWETNTLNDIYGPEVAEKLRNRMREMNIIP